MCLNIGTPKTINFPSNGKLMVLGVPGLKKALLDINFLVY